MSPAYWNGHVYVAGIGDSLQAYTLSAGMLSTSPDVADDRSSSTGPAARP